MTVRPDRPLPGDAASQAHPGEPDLREIVADRKSSPPTELTPAQRRVAVANAAARRAEASLRQALADGG